MEKNGKRGYGEEEQRRGPRRRRTEKREEERATEKNNREERLALSFEEIREAARVFLLKRKSGRVGYSQIFFS